MNITELKEKTIDELTKVAKELSVEGAKGLRKQDLIFAILQAQTEKTGLCLTGSDFSAHPITVICRARMIYMYRHHR